MSLFPELPVNSQNTQKKKFPELTDFPTPSKQDILTQPMTVVPLNKIEGVGRYLNSSSYDKLGFSLDPNLESKYYQETPWYEQLKNSTAQLFGQANTAWDAHFSKLEQIKETFGTTDDDYLKDTYQASEDLRAKYPVFKSENEVYGLLGYVPFSGGAFSKWTNFAPNLGFSVGTMAGVFVENAVATAIIELTTAGGGTPLAAAKWTKELYDGVKAIKNAFNLKKVASLSNVGKGLYEGEKILGSAGNILRGVEAFKAGKSLNGTLHSIYGGYQLYSNAASEALIENANSVGEVMKDFKNDFIEKNGREPNGEELARMQESAEGLILPSSLGNIGILMASNALQEMNAFKAGKSLSSLALTGSSRVGEAVGKRVVFDKATGLYRERLASEIAKTRLKSLGRFTLGLASEGAEESAQGVIAEATKNYFKAKYYNKPIGWTDALGQGFAYASSDQGMEEFYAGVVTGGLFTGGGRTINQYKLKRDEKSLFEKTGKTVEQLAQEERTDLNEKVIPLLKYNLATSQSSENVRVQTVVQQKMSEAYANGKQLQGDIYRGEGLKKAMFTAKYYGKDEELLKHYKELNKLERGDLARYLNVEESELASPEEFEETIKDLEVISNSIDRIVKNLPNPTKKLNISDPKYANMDPEEMQEAYINDSVMFEAWQGAQELLVSQEFLLYKTKNKYKNLKLDLESTNVPLDLLAAVMSRDDETSSLQKKLFFLQTRLSETEEKIKTQTNKKELKNLNIDKEELTKQISEISEKVKEDVPSNPTINYLTELTKRIQEKEQSLQLLEESEKTNDPLYIQYLKERQALEEELLIVADERLSQEEKLTKINKLRPDDQKFKFDTGDLLRESNINNLNDIINAFDLLGELKDTIDYSEDIIGNLSSPEKMKSHAALMFSRIYTARKELFSNILEGRTSEDEDVEEETPKTETEEKPKEKKKPLFQPGNKVIYQEKEYTLDKIEFKDGESTYILKDEKDNVVRVTDASELSTIESLDIKSESTIKDITDEEYKNFIDNGVVAAERIVSIANKIKNNEKLSDKENAIFTDKTSEINKELELLKQKETKEAQPSDLETKKSEVKEPTEAKEELSQEEKMNNEILEKLSESLDEAAFTGARELTEEEKALEQEIIKTIQAKYGIKEKTPEQKLNFLNNNEGRVVKINDIQGVLTKVNENLFELETPNKIYELSPEDIKTFEQGSKPKSLAKYKVKNVTETEVVVNDVKYKINTDTKGNIISLSPENKPTQEIKNENLLVAVEIERNKKKVADATQTNQRVDKLEGYYPVLNKMLEKIWDANMTDTIAVALDKLYDNKPITESEALQTAIWLKDVFERIAEFIKPSNTKEENDVILETYNIAEGINSLLYDNNNITTNYEENNKTATDVEEVKSNVSSKRDPSRNRRKNKVEKTTEEESGPKEKLVESLKQAKQLVNKIKNIRVDLKEIFTLINKKDYNSWKSNLDSDKLSLDIEEISLPGNDQSTNDVEITKYLLNRYIDTQLGMLGETNLGEKKEEEVIKTEPGNSGNLNVADALDTLDPVSKRDAEAPIKTKEEFIQELAQKIADKISQGKKYRFTKVEKEFYENNKNEINYLVEQITNPVVESKEEKITKESFIDLFNKLLLISGKSIDKDSNPIYSILKRIKFSIADQWFKFKTKEVSYNLKKVLEKLAKTYTNVTFSNIPKKYFSKGEETQGAETYVNRIINKDVEKDYDEFKLFEHQHSLHLDITKENTEAIMNILMDFANNNKVYILIGSAYNIARPDNIRIYSKEEKIPVEKLDNLLSRFTTLTSSTIDNPVINDIQYERLPSTQELIDFLKTVDEDIKEQILNYLGLYEKDRDFLKKGSTKDYKNGLSLNSLSSAKILAEAYNKFKQTGKLNSKDIIEPVIRQQLKKAAFYGEVSDIYNELLSNDIFRQISNTNYFKSLVETAKAKMDKLSVFNFANRTLSIGTVLYDKDNEYTIIDNTILGKNLTDLKNKDLKFIKVLKLINNLTKEESFINQFEFKNNYSTEPIVAVASPEDLEKEKEKQTQENEFNKLPFDLFTTISNDDDIFFVKERGRREKKEVVDENSAVGRLVVQRLAEQYSNESDNDAKIKFETPTYDDPESPFYLQPGVSNPNVPERIQEFILEKLNGKTFSELSPEELKEVKTFFGKTGAMVDNVGNYITYDKNGFPSKDGIIPMFFVPKGELKISGDSISYGGRELMPISTMVKKLEMTEEEVKQRARAQADFLDKLHSNEDPDYITISNISEGVKDSEDILTYEDVKRFDEESKLKFEMSRTKKEKGQIYMHLNGSTTKLEQKAIGEDMALAILAYLGVEDGYFLSRGFKVGKGIKSRYSELLKKVNNASNNLEKFKAKKEYLDFLNRTLFTGLKNFNVLFDVYFMMDSNPEIFDAISLMDYNTDKTSKEGIPNLFEIGNTWKRVNNNKNNDDYYSYLDTVTSMLSKLVFDTSPDFVESTYNNNFVTKNETLDIEKVYVKEYLMEKYSVNGIIVNDSLLSSMNRYLYLKPRVDKKVLPTEPVNFEDMDLESMINGLIEAEMKSELPSRKAISKEVKTSARNEELPATDDFKNKAMSEIRNSLKAVNAALSEDESKKMKSEMKKAKTMSDVNKIKMDIFERYNCKIK